MPLMFGTIRLAKYNMDQDAGLKKDHTVGLTTPIAAIALFSYVHFNHQIDGDYGDPRTALMLVAGISVLMVSPIPFIKFPLLTFKSGRSNSIILTIFIVSMIGVVWFKGLLLLPVILLFIGWNIIHWFLNPHKILSKQR